MSRDVIFDESASWYKPEPIPSEPFATNLDIDSEEDDQLKLTTEGSPISTRFSGPLEPPSDQSTLRPNPKSDKGKVKMPEFQDSNGNESAHSLDSEYVGLPYMRTPRAKQALTTTGEKLCRSTREKNVVGRFGYNDDMAYHYAFMMRVATVREPTIFSEATKDPRWVEAMNEEMQALSMNKTWDLIPSSPH